MLLFINKLNVHEFMNTKQYEDEVPILYGKYNIRVVLRDIYCTLCDIELQK